MTDAESKRGWRCELLETTPEPWGTFLVVAVMLLTFPIWLPICFCTAMYMTIRGFFGKGE